MKKILSILLVAAMLLSFTSCGNEAENTEIEEVRYHSLYFDIEFESNFIFSRYDIEVYLDDTRVGLIQHGKHFTELIDVAEGEHIVHFYKEGDHSISQSATVNINEDCTLITTLHSYSSSIEANGTKKTAGITGNALTMPSLKDKVLRDAVNELKQIGFTNIHYSLEVWDESNWTVTGQNIKEFSVIDKNVAIELTCEKRAVELDAEIPSEVALSEQTENEDEDASSEQNESTDQDNLQEDKKIIGQRFSSEEKSQPVSYSTNDRQTAKKGNSGVFAYLSKGATGWTYYIIDFDEGYVYWFFDNGLPGYCDKIKIKEGDLNSKLIFTMKDETDSLTQALHFKWKNNPEHLIVEDEYGGKFDYSATNLESALEVRDKMTMYVWE